MLPTIAWQDDDIVMVDQRKLPATEVYVTCKNVNDVAKAIKTMVIRGAPAIGVCAAMGLALGAARSKATGTKQFTTEFQRNCDLLAATRPTAVNLFWAIERMKRAFSDGALAGESVDQLKARLRTEADRIHDDDVASCRAIGAHGATLVPAEAHILTHCNAGALATAGYGTALGVIRGAVEAGRKVRVLADETRPFLQGARLTAWELVKDGIDTTVITDNMAGAIMRAGEIDLVVVGADRIAANGDTANKIGTYTVAVLAREHGIPFYVAAPWSTIDLATADGDAIPIEERDAARSDARRQQPAGARRRARAQSGLRRDAARSTSPRSSPSAVSIVAPFDRDPRQCWFWELKRRAIETAAGASRDVLRRNRRGTRRGASADRWAIRSNVVASQVDIHREWGGVVPELASRQHVRDICGVVERALADGGATWADVDALAVTQGPGLVGSLLVGVSFAKAAAWALGKPLVAVNHLAGHIESIWLEHGPIPLPAVVLVVSGGHTSLYLVKREGEYQLLGRTRDDAAGEAYDKVAKLLGLGYPGGPIIDRLAQRGQRRGDSLAGHAADQPRSQRARARRPVRFQLQRPEDRGAAARAATAGRAGRRATAAAGNRRPRRELPAPGGRDADRSHVRRGALARREVDRHRRRRVGELAAAVRTRCAKAERSEIPVYIPRLSLSTDNAAMIAAAGLRQLAAGHIAPADLNAAASLPL